MANPFLVLGGVAVGLITVTLGVLQVPGWISNAQNSAAMSDIEQVTASQAAAITVHGHAFPGVDALNASDNGVIVTVTGDQCVLMDADEEDYVVSIRSLSGTWFSRINGGPIGSDTVLADSLDDAGTLPGTLAVPDEAHCGA